MSCVFALDGGHDEEARTEGAIPSDKSSIVVAVAAVAVAAAVVAAVPVLDEGQAVVGRGRGREYFCESRILVAANWAVRRPLLVYDNTSEH